MWTCALLEKIYILCFCATFGMFLVSNYNAVDILT